MSVRLGLGLGLGFRLHIRLWDRIGLGVVEVVPKPVSDALFLPHLVGGRARVLQHFWHVVVALRFALRMPFLSEDLG